MSQKQFENEVDLLMRLEHPNIVRLVGYCYEIENEHFPLNGKYVFAGKAESLLCLEYLPNGSLDEFLSDSDKSSRLDWHTRYKIIEGTCSGLQYLHKQTDGPIIHLDLKPANLLLNDALEPKLADFGLSRLLDQQGTVCTMEVNGTLGYMPPEYLQGILGTMSDIFSLGVIILEIVTGERKYPDNIPPLEEFIETELEKWRDTLQKAPGYTSLEIDCLQIRRCIQVGLKCMNPSRAKRPTITKVIKMLQGLGGMDCNISNEVTPTAAQIRSGPRELLDIHPLELSFSLDSDKQIRCLVKLTNKTNECVAFHFKVTGVTNKYCIEPAGRFLLPREMTYLVVTMETRGELPALDLQCNDQFLVQSIIVREDRVTSKPIPGQTFDKMPISVVHKVKLAVIHVPAVIVRKDRVTSKPIPGHTFDKMPISVVHKVKLPVIHVPAVQGTLNPQQSEGSQGKLLGRPNISDKDNEYTLVECLGKDLGYCAGKPIAAVLIYKCFVQWRTFESQTTSSFDCIIHLIGSALEDQDNNETAAYWLSNSFALLLLMKRTSKSSAAAPQRQRFMRTGDSPQSSVFGRIEKSNLQQAIEAHPALLFKQQLTAYLEKTYRMIRDNLKREISPFLDHCIQAPRTARISQIHGASVANVLAQQIGHWQSIVKIITNYLGVLKSNHVPSFLICKMFGQIFSFINVQLFMSLLLRRACCSFSHGEYVKAGLAELEQWIIDATEKVITSMKTIMTEESENGVVVPFLFDDDESIPFSLQDLQKCARVFEVTDVDMPPLVLEYPCFNFLHKTKDKLDGPALQS
ncbi:hypothetical protein CFC21_098688 [Triticum aestivum]|uniref:non-specific serine/threonine protein kinase n=2 Tax=Triticum aestivum TaxID=4565 RepID=A0A9R1N135_WHEAT|nr:uncharacterized protein LOC123148028 isoform X2 [Triticum aestivum]KAF7096790.1 hypothetical protein CFC21_098688 [Triticum aestivum]